MTHNNSELDEIFDNVWMAGHSYANMGEGLEGLRKANENDRGVMSNAKQQILSNYLPKADLVEYLNGLKFNHPLKCDCTKRDKLLDEIIKYVNSPKN